MISLLAAIAGFFGSILPYIVNLLKDMNDKKHELAIFDKQIKMQQSGINERLDDTKILAECIERQALYKNYNTKIKWVDAFNGTVRPVLAYSFFILYVFVKYTQASFLLSIEPTFKALDIIWSTEDQAIFAGIISFYFGQRTISKINGR